MMFATDKLPELGSDSDVFSSALKNEVVIEDAEIQLSGITSYALLLYKTILLYKDDDIFDMPTFR